MAENGIDLSKITLEYQKKPGVNKSKKLIVDREDYENKDEEALRKNVFANVAEKNGKWSIDKGESKEILEQVKKYAGDDNIFTASEMKEMFTDWGYFDQRKDTDTESEEEWFKKGVEDFTNYMASAFDVDITGFDVEKAAQEAGFAPSQSGATDTQGETQTQTTEVVGQAEAQAKVDDLTSQIAKADEQFPLTINENSKIVPVTTAEDGTKSVTVVKESGGNSVYGILNNIYGYNSMKQDQKKALVAAFMDANPDFFPSADSGMTTQERLDARKTLQPGDKLTLPETTAYLASQELKEAQSELDVINEQSKLYEGQYEEGDSINRETTESGKIKETLADSDGKTKSVVFYSEDNVPETKYDYVRDDRGAVTEQYQYDLTSDAPDKPSAIYHFAYAEQADGTLAVSSKIVEKDFEYDAAGQMSHSITYDGEGKTVLAQTSWTYNEDGSVSETKYDADGTTPQASVTTVNGQKTEAQIYDNGVLSESRNYSYDENGNLSEFSSFNCENFKNTVQKYSYDTGERVMDSVVVQQYADAEKSQLQLETTYASDGKTVVGKSVYDTAEYNGQNYEVKAEYAPSPDNSVVITYTDAAGNVAYEDMLECFDDPIANENSIVKKHTAVDYAAGTIITKEYNEDETLKSVTNADIEGNVQGSSLYQYVDGALLLETTLNASGNVSNEKYYQGGELSSTKDYIYDTSTGELKQTVMGYTDGNPVMVVNYENGVKVSDDFYIYKDGVRSSKIVGEYDANGVKTSETRYGEDDSTIESKSTFEYNEDGTYSKQIDYLDGRILSVAYNTAQKPVTYVMEDAEGNVTYSSLITYDDKGRKLTETSTVRNGNPYENVAYFYQEDGSYSVTTNKYKEGKVSETTVENYDKDGKLIEDTGSAEAATASETIANEETATQETNDANVTSSYADYDGDGVNDAIVYYTMDESGTEILSAATDDNMDGTIDSMSYNEYDENGNVVALKVDSNNNGIIDQTYSYTENKGTYDLDEDGKIDSVLYDRYNDAGVRTSQEIDADNDGKIDAVTYYRYDDEGNLIAIEDDNDNDGTIDNRTEL